MKRFEITYVIHGIARISAKDEADLEHRWEEMSLKEIGKHTETFGDIYYQITGVCNEDKVVHCGEAKCPSCEKKWYPDDEEFFKVNDNLAVACPWCGQEFIVKEVNDG
jgi:predicted  nucleic acid-binding Zn ribbon protein